MQTPDFSAVILRYFNPVGAHESGRIGEAPQGEPSNLLPRLTRAAAGSLPPLVIAGDDFPTPDGTGLRDYVHVCDIAQGHVAALEALERRPSGVLTCNLGAGRPVSVRELIDTFERPPVFRCPAGWGRAAKGIWRPAGPTSRGRGRSLAGAPCAPWRRPAGTHGTGRAKILSAMTGPCFDCPRACGADRSRAAGLCGAPPHRAWRAPRCTLGRSPA